MTKMEFCRAVTILVDTREKCYQHVIDGLERLGVRHEARKLDIGDYSFATAGRDFSMTIAVEKKSGPEEIYTNLFEKKNGKLTHRLEREMAAGGRNLNQFVLLIEDVATMNELRAYVVPGWKMKTSPQRVKADIGETCYATLRSWQQANRYNFRIECVKDKSMTAAKLLDEFFYYYKNYAERTTQKKAGPSTWTK